MSLNPRSFAMANLLPLGVFSLALLVAYGYEVFSFNLTIDEDSIATTSHWVRFIGSIGEGRWAMSVLSLMLPSPVTPAVSTGMAVAASGAAWWLLSRKFLQMTPWQSAFAATLAGTVPTLAFIFSFSTVAFAIGIGNLLLVGFVVGLSSPSWKHRGLAVLAGGAAIGIYDTFALSIVALGVAYIWLRATWGSAALAVAASVLSYAISTTLVTVVGLILNQPRSAYVGNFFDVPGLVDRPLERLSTSLADTWDTISLSSERFGLHSPWFVIVLALLFGSATLTIVVSEATLSERVLRALCLVGLVSIPLIAEAVASVVLLRSMLYLPTIVLVLFGMSIGGFAWLRDRLPTLGANLARFVVAGIVVLAVLGNSAITNRLFSVAATTYTLDQTLAFTIGQEKDRLLSGQNVLEIPAVVIGKHTWPSGSFTEATETFGGSLFGFNGSRTITFLRAHGVLLSYPTEAQVENVENLSFTLPAYPQPGWVSLQDGILVINFGGEVGP